MITILHKLCATKLHTINKQFIGLYIKCNINFHSSTYQNSIRKSSKRYHNGIIDPFQRNYKTTRYDIDTNVKNDVFLYKFENWNFLRKLMLFQTIVLNACGICIYYASNPIWQTISEGNFSMKEVLFENVGPSVLCSSTLVFGVYTCIVTWFMIRRTIKYIILHKGGEHVTLVTYHPIKKEEQFTVPLKMVEPKLFKKKVDHYSGLRVKGRRLFYVMDGKGIINNQTLFDHTVGIRKRWMSSF